MTEQSDKVKDNKESYLTGRLLLAMPGMGDSRFSKAVIYICAHDENGAMGLVINHTLPGIDLKQLLSQLNITVAEHVTDRATKTPVLSGGPVETARGFVLHSNDFEQADTISVDNNFSVTGTVDALEAIATGRGPEEMLFLLGYAGWTAGQLDSEIQDNAWLVVESDHELIFGLSPDEKWDHAVQKLGVDPAMLSGAAGRA